MIKFCDSTAILQDISQAEIELLAQSIEKLFSFEIDKPRILINKNILPNFCDLLSKKCEVDFLNVKKTSFMKYVHRFEFDLGLFFDENKIFFVSGNGNNLSNIKMSILKKVFL